jgi:molecular chaperone GrpE (heat shock protein)
MPPPPPEDFSFIPGQQSDGQQPSYKISPTFGLSDLLNMDGEEFYEGEDSEIKTSSPWKAALRDDFESWLATMDEIPAEFEDEQDPDDNPDLATVFGDLSSLALESRKSNRRTSDAFSQWNEVLTSFQNELKRLRERERVLLENQPPADPVPAPLASFLVDFHDRLTRLAEAQAIMPSAKIGFFGDDTAWKSAWNNQRSALDITLSHLRTVLKEQGFQRILTIGQPLDPTRMAVIETRLDAGKSPHTVIEEISPGWMIGTRILRPAQVIVSIPTQNSNS